MLISVYLVQINILEKIEKRVLQSLEHPLTELKPSFLLCFGSLFRMPNVSGLATDERRCWLLHDKI